MSTRLPDSHEVIEQINAQCTSDMPVPWQTRNRTNNPRIDRIFSETLLAHANDSEMSGRSEREAMYGYLIAVDENGKRYMFVASSGQYPKFSESFENDLRERFQAEDRLSKIEVVFITKPRGEQLLWDNYRYYDHAYLHPTKYNPTNDNLPPHLDYHKACAEKNIAQYIIDNTGRLGSLTFISAATMTYDDPKNPTELLLTNPCHSCQLFGPCMEHELSDYGHVTRGCYGDPSMRKTPTIIANEKFFKRLQLDSSIDLTTLNDTIASIDIDCSAKQTLLKAITKAQKLENTLNTAEEQEKIFNTKLIQLQQESNKLNVRLDKAKSDLNAKKLAKQGDIERLINQDRLAKERDQSRSNSTKPKAIRVMTEQQAIQKLSPKFDEEIVKAERALADAQRAYDASEATIQRFNDRKPKKSTHAPSNEQIEENTATALQYDIEINNIEKILSRYRKKTKIKRRIPNEEELTDEMLSQLREKTESLKKGKQSEEDEDSLLEKQKSISQIKSLMSMEMADCFEEGIAPPDGHCFLHSLVRGQFPEMNEVIQNLIVTIYGHLLLKTFTENIAQYCEKAGLDPIEAYDELENYVKNRTWGVRSVDLAAIVMSDALGIDICIDTQSTPIAVLSQSNAAPPFNARKTLYLRYDGGHYTPLYKGENYSIDNPLDRELRFARMLESITHEVIIANLTNFNGKNELLAGYISTYMRGIQGGQDPHVMWDYLKTKLDIENNYIQVDAIFRRHGVAANQLAPVPVVHPPIIHSSVEHQSTPQMTLTRTQKNNRRKKKKKSNLTSSISSTQPIEIQKPVSLETTNLAPSKSTSVNKTPTLTMHVENESTVDVYNKAILTLFNLSSQSKKGQKPTDLNAVAQYNITEQVIREAVGDRSSSDTFVTIAEKIVKKLVPFNGEENAMNDQFYKALHVVENYIISNNLFKQIQPKPEPFERKLSQ